MYTKDFPRSLLLLFVFQISLSRKDWAVCLSFCRGNWFIFERLDRFQHFFFQNTRDLGNQPTSQCYDNEIDNKNTIKILVKKFSSPQQESNLQPSS